MGIKIDGTTIVPKVWSGGPWVKFDDIKEFLKPVANTGSMSASQINHALKNMESNDERVDFIADILDGICYYCGEVSDPCYCRCDD
jgi:hypothetical protein